MQPTLPSLRPGDPASRLPASSTSSLVLYGGESSRPDVQFFLGISQGKGTVHLSCPLAQTWPEETIFKIPHPFLFLASEEGAGAILDSCLLLGILESHWILPWVLTPTVPFLNQ